jgi:hypothetical protein
MMIVDINECRRKKQELQDDYDRLVRWRWSLEQARTIDHRNLTEIDAMLAEHPLLEPEMDLKIKSRAIRILWLEYGGGDPDNQRSKHEILLVLRELHRSLPTHIRLELWQDWFRWLDEFEEEAIAAGERAVGDRVYVYEPRALDKLRRELG